IGRSTYRSRSMPIASRPNAATASWRSGCHAPSATNPRRSPSAEISIMEADMARSQELEVQQKKELASKQEKTTPARHYIPSTDIYESEDALTVVMEVPGVEKKDVDVRL